MVETVELKDPDVRGILAIGGLSGFFLMIFVLLYIIYNGKISIDESMSLISYVGTFIGGAIGYYFGKQSAGG